MCVGILSNLQLHFRPSISMTHRFKQSNASKNEQAAEIEQDASVESVQKAGNPKLLRAKWAAVLLLVVVVAWWLKEMCQPIGGEVQQSKVKDTSTVQEGIYTKIM